MIVQVKENQKKLLESCEKTAKEIEPVDSSISRTEGRNRKERRTVRVFDSFIWVSSAVKAGWNGLFESIIQVTRTKRIFDTNSKSWKKSKEIAYYISTNLFSAKASGRAIRKHWWIENSDHYVRDVDMGEDASRIRSNSDRMVVMRSFGLNLMRINGVKNVKRQLYANSLNLEKVLRYKQLLE